MSTDLFTGRLIRLTGPRPEDAELLCQWFNEPGFHRAAAGGPVYHDPLSRWEAWEKDFNSNPESCVEFRIRPVLNPDLPQTQPDNRLIGYVKLYGIDRVNRSATLGIGIGDCQNQSKGYGSEAIQLLLNYAFQEQNLHRVGLTVYEYNQKAQALYERLGFVVEGRRRQSVYHDGRYYDRIEMGILREEWERRWVIT